MLVKPQKTAVCLRLALYLASRSSPTPRHRVRRIFSFKDARIFWSDGLHCPAGF